MPKAASLAELIKSKFGVEPELIGGSGGIFDVKADGTLIYSKHKTGRFPDPEEVLDPLSKAKG